MDVCREIVPQEVRFADGVRVACHLYPASDEIAARVVAAHPVHVTPHAAPPPRPTADPEALA
jgi:hypothetical protein